jgi:hypothetical protein
MKEKPRYVLVEEAHHNVLRTKLKNSGLIVSSTNNPNSPLLTKKQITLAERIANVPNYKPKQPSA